MRITKWGGGGVLCCVVINIDSSAVESSLSSAPLAVRDAERAQGFWGEANWTGRCFLHRRVGLSCLMLQRVSVSRSLVTADQCSAPLTKVSAWCRRKCSQCTSNSSRKQTFATCICCFLRKQITKKIQRVCAVVCYLLTFWKLNFDFFCTAIL